MTEVNPITILVIRLLIFSELKPKKTAKGRMYINEDDIKIVSPITRSTRLFLYLIVVNIE